MSTITWTNPDNYSLTEIAIDDLTALDLREATEAVMIESVAAYRVTILKDDGFVDSVAGQMCRGC